MFPDTRYHAAVTGIGGYLPSRVVTNTDLAQTLDTNDEWIRARVGIEKRHIAAPDETIVDMAVEAGKDALKDADIPPDEIDLVITASCTYETPIPGASAPTAFRLGIYDAGAYDVNAACAGFCYGMAQASNAIRTGDARNALVIGVEKFSDWLDPADRSTAIIFGDGAGAAVISRSDTQRIGPVVWGHNGDRSEAIIIPDRHSMLTMDGQAVFRWATTTIRHEVTRVCERSGIAMSDIDVFVPHQANNRITDALLRHLDFRDDIVVGRDIAQSGNTSAASIPLALGALVRNGQASSGDIVLVIGFGAGLAFAGQVFAMP